MLIPYFYLEVGGVKILQPQNKQTDFSFTYNSQEGLYLVKSIQEPEVDTFEKVIYVNGSHKSKDYQFLDVSYCDHSVYFLEAINHINENRSLNV